jgi:hypothetical protein
VFTHIGVKSINEKILWIPFLKLYDSEIYWRVTIIDNLSRNDEIYINIFAIQCLKTCYLLEDLSEIYF